MIPSRKIRIIHTCGHKRVYNTRIKSEKVVRQRIRDLSSQDCKDCFEKHREESKNRKYARFAGELIAALKYEITIFSAPLIGKEDMERIRAFVDWLEVNRGAEWWYKKRNLLTCDWLLWIASELKIDPLIDLSLKTKAELGIFRNGEATPDTPK